MKLIEAIIQPFKLDDVKLALSQVDVQGLTVSEVQGFGHQKGRRTEYRGTVTQAQFVPKLKLEILVSDEAVPRVHEAILRTARTGNPGDGKIFVYDVDQIVRIRTGEKGASAV